MTSPVHSLVVPIYRNALMIRALVAAVDGIADRLDGSLEAIYVVDGSPDDSRACLDVELVEARTPARVVEHSRNFGAFAAIRTGMNLARGQYIAVMAADLQEPPELIVTFFERLSQTDAEVVVGERVSRDDRGDLASKLFWRLYRRFVVKDMPNGGVDVFGCTAQVRDVICSLEQVHTSLVAQLFWVGFRRQLVPYDRRSREGESGWTLSKKLKYTSDSVFAFSDLPVKILWMLGLLGLIVGVAGAVVVLVLRLLGTIHVPGYAATVIVLLIALSINSVGLGIIGSYVWRAYETVKGRPGAIVRDVSAVAEEHDDG